MTWLNRRRALVRRRSSRRPAGFPRAAPASASSTIALNPPTNARGPEGVSRGTAAITKPRSLVVPRPGVAREHPAPQRRRARRLRCGAIELAARFLDYPVPAITGTNGKSTTTALLGQCLPPGDSVFVGSNLGTPLSPGDLDESFAVASKECSSFQLEWVDASARRRRAAQPRAGP
jgi:UDP-N-acetylmuramoylalanine-D-glutamate ligase